MSLITEGHRKLAKLKAAESILGQLSRRFSLSLNAKVEWHISSKGPGWEDRPQPTEDMGVVTNKKVKNLIFSLYGVKGGGIC